MGRMLLIFFTNQNRITHPDWEVVSEICPHCPASHPAGPSTACGEHVSLFQFILLMQLPIVVTTPEVFFPFTIYPCIFYLDMDKKDYLHV